MSSRSQTQHPTRSGRRSELRAISTPPRAVPLGPLSPVDTEVDMELPLSLAQVRGAPRPDSPRYRVLGSIHRGGMGEILLAKVEGPGGFSRKVVLKGLLSRLSEDDVSYRLFMREARLMSRLDHPNIVRVFDLPTINSRPYLAMEYLRGRNFHQVIQRAAVKTGGVPVRIALAIVSQALRGLHYAHVAKGDTGEHLGVTHRDISPGNLLVSFFGEVKVTDFGIAKLADSPRYTGPRSIRGKARYVAPEQVHGENATPLSDIYSAGVVLSEALLGEPLWERSSIPETLLAIVSEERDAIIDRIATNAGDPPGLRAALRGSLALKPSNRFSSALQFAEVLEAIGNSVGPPVSTVELGLYIRDLFKEAPDVPSDDGFGRSGIPVPRFTMSAEDSVSEDTDASGVTLAPELSPSAVLSATLRMRPESPSSAHASSPSEAPAAREASALPSEPMGGDSGFDELDTLVKSEAPGGPSAEIRASALAEDAAVVEGEPAVDQVGASNVAVREELSCLEPRVAQVSEEATAQRTMAVLLGGIFIGAGLAISGCVVALLMG